MKGNTHNGKNAQKLELEKVKVKVSVGAEVGVQVEVGGSPIFMQLRLRSSCSPSIKNIKNSFRSNPHPPKKKGVRKVLVSKIEVETKMQSSSSSGL